MKAELKHERKKSNVPFSYAYLTGVNQTIQLIPLCGLRKPYFGTDPIECLNIQVISSSFHAALKIVIWAN